MSENTVTISETENVENVTAPENGENVETVNVESTPETVETEVSAEDAAKAAIDAIDEDNPVKAMVLAFRKALADKGEAINALVKEIKAGGDEIDEKIDDLITESTDTETVEMRERLAKMRAAVDSLNGELRSKIAAENDLTPMTEEVKAEKTEAVSEMRRKYSAVKSSSEKALKNMLPDGANVDVFFGDLSGPSNVSGGTGSGKAKPRLSKNVWVEFKGEKYTVIPTIGNDWPTFGDVAEYVSKKSGLMAAGNRIKPTEISEVAVANGLVSAGIVDFEFTTSEGANVFKIHAETRASDAVA